jgi:hypothetical protein
MICSTDFNVAVTHPSDGNENKSSPSCFCHFQAACLRMRDIAENSGRHMVLRFE